MNIDRVQIKNFKSLKNIDITLSNLTLITGVNSSGKSSFIQALLLLRQNLNIIINKFLYNEELMEKIFSKEKINNNMFFNDSPPLNLNDEYVKLGRKEDIFFEESYNENIDINIFLNNQNKFLLSIDNKLNLKKIAGDYTDFNLFKNDFQTISTDRISPNITYNLSNHHINQNLIGIRGEYTAHYLAENQYKPLSIEKLRDKDSKTNQLLENVSLWLSKISNDIEISARVYRELEQVNLTYSYTYGENKTNKYTPLNVGFGVTYVLPIIVAILKAKEGDLVIIENPESHLHPKGQSKIAELCAIASANGVQIIVETHSDHFLNGIMIATKNKILKPEDSKVYFFKKEQDELETKIDELNINSEGKIDKWPKEFFDQYENDLMELL